MLSRCSPSYLCDLFEPYIPSHALCSAVVSQQAAGPFPNVPLSSVKPPCWHQTARLCWSLWIPTKNSSFRKPLYLSNPLFVCCPISTWRSKLCAFLSLASPLFTQASLCWISGHPGTHLSLSPLAFWASFQMFSIWIFVLAGIQLFLLSHSCFHSPICVNDGLELCLLCFHVGFPLPGSTVPICFCHFRIA